MVRNEERVSELEAAVKELESQLNQQEDETKAVIAKWQANCSALEEQNKDLTGRLQVSADNVLVLEAKLEDTQRGLDVAEAKIKDDEDVVAKWQGECVFLLVCDVVEHSAY